MIQLFEQYTLFDPDIKFRLQLPITPVMKIGRIFVAENFMKQNSS